MLVEESSVNSHVNPSGEEGLPFDASTILGVRSPLSLTTTAMLGANNDPQGTTAAPRDEGNPVRKLSASMNQIWETLTKISTFIETLQKNHIVAKVERYSNFLDIEKWIKNLENLSKTTPLSKSLSSDLEA